MVGMEVTAEGARAGLAKKRAERGCVMPDLFIAALACSHHSHGCGNTHLFG